LFVCLFVCSVQFLSLTLQGSEPAVVVDHTSEDGADSRERMSTSKGSNRGMQSSAGPSDRLIDRGSSEQGSSFEYISMSQHSLKETGSTSRENSRIINDGTCFMFVFLVLFCF
jgi:hypothetical protein